MPGAGAAAAALGGISYASMAIVTLAYPDTAFPQLPEGSGYLVPAVDGRPVKAVTFSSVKWPHLRDRAGGLVFVRCSVGRIGEEAILQRDDGELAALAAADLAAATGVRGAPADVLVTRWGGALPQYTVGHLDRVARIQAGLAAQPGLAACGAAYAGVGIPACIATARAAVDQALAGLRAGVPGDAASRSGIRSGGARTVRAENRPMGTTEGVAEGGVPEETGAESPGGAAGTGVLPADPAPDPEPQRPRARDLNELIRYTMWSVFRITGSGALEAAGSLEGVGRDGLADEVAELSQQAAGKGVVTRGCYDLQGLRADADYMFWWHAPSSDDLQEMFARFRRTGLGRASEPVWSAMALHRPAEFNKSHVPAFLAEEEPRAYVSVYPFVRSYEWYLMDPSQRRELLAEHGKMAREYPDVRANTVACFSLNDYEWLLAFEADELHRIVDLMRHLRGARARLHTRVEIPFYTGRRKPVHELVHALP